MTLHPSHGVIIMTFPAFLSCRALGASRESSGSLLCWSTCRLLPDTQPSRTSSFEQFTAGEGRTKHVKPRNSSSPLRRAPRGRVAPEHGRWVPQRKAKGCKRGWARCPRGCGGVSSEVPRQVAGRGGAGRAAPGRPCTPASWAPFRIPSLRFASRGGGGEGRAGRSAGGGRGGAARHSSARQRKTSRESGSVPRPAAPPLPGTGREAAAPARPRSPEVSAALGREGGGRRGAREARTAAGACPRVSRTGSGLMRGILLETDLFGSVLWVLVERGAWRCVCFFLCSVFLFVRVSVPCPCPAAPQAVASPGGLRRGRQDPPRCRREGARAAWGQRGAGLSQSSLCAGGTELAQAPSDAHFSLNQPLPEPLVGLERVSRSCHPPGGNQWWQAAGWRFSDKYFLSLVVSVA